MDDAALQSYGGNAEREFFGKAGRHQQLPMTNLMERRDVHTATGRFATLQAGDPCAPLVICAHGFPDHAPTFDAMAPALVAAGYRVVAPWMRGYSPSIAEGPYGQDTISRDIVALADALSPSAPVFLVGHDWGASAVYGAAAIATERVRAVAALAVPHPLTFVRALGSSAAQRRRSWYMAYFQLPFLPERRVRKDDFAFIDRLYRDWSPGFTPEPAYMSDLKRCLSASMPAPLEYYRSTFRVTPLRMWKLRPFLRASTRIRVPVLYLHGERDGCIGPEVATGQERFFKAAFRPVTVPNTGHFLHLEAPDTVSRHIVDWFGTAH